MKVLFAFYEKIQQYSDLKKDFPQDEFVFAPAMDDFKKEIVDTDVLFILAPKYSPTVAQIVKENAQKLKWIQASTVGVDDIIVNGTPEGVIVTKAVGVFDRNVAEQAMALLLSIFRQTAKSDRGKQEAQYHRDARWEETHSLEGKVAGIVGFGGIGKQTVKRLKAFDMTIYVHDILPTLSHPDIDCYYGSGQLAEMLPQLDVLVLTLPQTKDNIYMLDAPQFKAMKNNAVIINVSRGKLIKESALIEALNSGEIAACGMDVFEQEPLPADSPLYTVENIVMTPHLGGKGDLNEDRLAAILKENLASYQLGQPMKFVVDLKTGF